MQPVKATLIDDDRFRLLAIPFSGPIPFPGAPRGADLDAQWFSPNTDIRPDWLTERAVDWHHGRDDTGNPGNKPVMGKAIIGKATDLTLEDDGWWVDVWLQHGERRLQLIKRLADRGAELFGSSEPVGTALVRNMKGDVVPYDARIPGEIVFWPYWRQTLSTSPQNTHSVLHGYKALLDDMHDSQPTDAFWADLRVALDDLGRTSDLTSGMGEGGAKAGRVLSAANENLLRAALDSIGQSVGRLDEVLAKLRKEQEGDGPEP